MRHKRHLFLFILLLLLSAFPAAGEEERFIPPEGVETVAWMSDTQLYAEKFTRIYPSMTSFLAENREALHLAYVVHTGDLVHHEQYATQWERAEEAMKLLGDIPYGVLAGNHDIGGEQTGLTRYAKRFGEAVFKDKPWYGASFQDNRGHYDLMTIGGRDYIFVYMSYDPDADSMAFMRDAFNAHPGRTGILCVHNYLNADGSLTTSGGEVHDEVVKACPNCYMVLCGHKYGTAARTEFFDDDGNGRDDRETLAVLMNYQGDGNNGGSGFLRLMQFDENKGVIRSFTYSPFVAQKNLTTEPDYRHSPYKTEGAGEETVIPMPWLFTAEGTVG